MRSGPPSAAPVRCAAAAAFWCCGDDGAERLAAALRNGRTGALFPADLALFSAAGIALPVQYAPNATRRDVESLRPGTLPELETVLEGARNNSLFDVLRWWAYPAWHSHRGDLEDWHEAVAERAHQYNALFPDPLGTLTGDNPREVDITAYSVSSWVASGGGPVDHSPSTQSWREGNSGRVRRGELRSKAPGDRLGQRTGRLRVEVRDRDRAIVADRAAGMKQVVIAERHGVTQGWVSKVLKRHREHKGEQKYS